MSRQDLLVQSFSRERGLRRGKVDVLWPCRLYSVSLLVSDDRLNLFETTVLRLAALGIARPDVIADTLCLPDATLPGFILSRLEKKKLVAGGMLTDDGRAWLQDAARGRHETVLMYQDMLGGHLLPYVTARQPVYLPLSPDGDFYLGSVDDEDNRLKRRFAFFLAMPNKKVAPPAPSEVSSALHAYEKICAQVPWLSASEPEHIRFVDDQAAIRLQPNPRMVFLHCLSSLTSDARDILVHNPFGYAEPLPQLIEALAAAPEAGDIKRRLLESRDGARTAGGGFTATVPGLPELSRDLENMAKASDAATYVRDAISALEHILWRILGEMDSAACAGLLCNSGNPENLERLALAARSMEQKMDEACSVFLSVAPTDIEKMLRGHLKFRPLLALHLFLATQGGHPLEAVFRQSPEVLRTMIRLHRLRNQAAHGDDAAWRIGTADGEKARWLLRELYGAWRPGAAALPVPECPTIDREEQDRKLLNEVEGSLLDFFDPAVRSGLDTSVGEALVSAEKQFLTYGIEELARSDKAVSQACVVDLANLCQLALRTEAGPVNMAEILPRAESSAKSAGFFLPEGKLPQALATAQERFIAVALTGDNTTLGAHCLAWLVLEKPAELARAGALCPLLLVHLGELVRLRGHGNEEVAARDVALIRRQIYKDLNLLFGGKTDEQDA